MEGVFGDDVVVVRTSDDAAIVVERGGYGPPWLLLHGFTTGPSDWLPVARRLVDCGYSVMLMTTRGHGDSTAGTGGYGIERLARDVVETADGLELQRFSIAAHSLGATVAAAAATAVGDRLARLVLVGATLRSVRGARRAGALFFGSTAGAAVVGRPILGRQLIKAWFASGAPRDLVEQERRLSASCPKATRLGITRALSHVDISNDASTLTVPTTVVHGGQDRAVPRREAEAVHQAIPGSSMRVVEDAGHMVLIERPEAVVDIICQSG